MTVVVDGALKKFIPELKRRGFTFGTVSDVVRGDGTVGTRSAEAKTPTGTKVTAQALVGLQRFSLLVARALQPAHVRTARLMPTVPGAIGAFRREALLAVAGVSDETLAGAVRSGR